jgi:hypothetical protein
VSRANDRTVMLVIESGATEIDESDVGSFHASRVPPLEKKDLFLNTLERKLILHSKSKFDNVIIVDITTVAHLFTVI